MKEFKIIAPIYGVVNRKKLGESLNLNWYRNAFYQTNNKAKKRFKVMIAPQLLALDPIPGKIRIDYHYYAKRKGTDLDNFVSAAKKYFQDALVELDIIVDDNVHYIVENREKFICVDKEDPRLEIFIKQLED